MENERARERERERKRARARARERAREKETENVLEGEHSRKDRKDVGADGRKTSEKYRVGHNGPESRIK